MKKLISSFVLLMINVFILIGCVNADMEGPNHYSAKAFVSNTNGTAWYDWNLEKKGTLPKDTEIEISGFFEGKSEYYSVSDIKSGDYYFSGYVKKEDISLTSDFVSEEGFSKNEDIRKVYVWKDDCYLYKGPSYVYDKSFDAKIPEGTILEYQYVSITDDAPGYGEYIYTTYNGTKGWVLTSNLAKLFNDKIMIVSDDVKLLNKTSDGFTFESSDIKIPKYTELEIEYIIDEYGFGYDFQYEKESYYNLNLSQFEYIKVKYNGAEGWINGKDVATPNLTNTKFIVVGENAWTSIESGESVKLPYFEEMDYSYEQQDNSFYVEYDGVKGWIGREFVAFPETTVKSIMIGNEEGAKVTNANGDSILIPYGTIIDKILFGKYITSDEYLYVVNYNNEKVLLNSKDCMMYDGKYRLYFVNNEVTMYKDKNLNSEVICIIPRFSKIIEKYEKDDYAYNQDFLYVEYGENKGWIYASKGYSDVDLLNLWYNSPDELAEELKYKIYLTLKDIEVGHYSAGEMTHRTIPANSKIAYVLTEAGQDGAVYFLYENEIYIFNGWINDEEMKLISVVEEDKLQEALSGDYVQEEEEVVIPNEVEITDNNKDIVVEKIEEEYTPKQIAIIAVVAAVIIALTAVIIIKLVNKKDSENDITNL